MAGPSGGLLYGLRVGYGSAEVHGRVVAVAEPKGIVGDMYGLSSLC